ncbi:MAG: uracil-DNA glycosylase [Gemmatimonadota bacterium]
MTLRSPPGGPLRKVQERIIECRLCPRLVAWREKVASRKRAAFSEEEYWGRPVPAFGDPDGRLLVVGLAPAAHGANRTGRMFTGDRSGDWLYRALFRAGFANQPDSRNRNDSLVLRDCLITAAVRCAPPNNKPTPAERDTCGAYLQEEIQLLTHARVMVALGKFAFDQLWRILKALGEPLPSPRPRFEHGLEVRVGSDLTLMASFHPSQQNTFTGKLTEEMFDGIWIRAAEILTSEAVET